MRYILFALLLFSGAAVAQQAGPGPMTPSTARPLFDDITPSSGIVFPTATEVQIPACSYTIPANTLVNNKDKLRWWAAGTNTGSTDVKTITARYAAILNTGNSGNLVGITSSATASGTQWTLSGYISKTGTGALRISAMGTTQNSGNSNASSSLIAAADMTAALLFVITGKSANATPPNDTVVCNEFHVSFEPGAPLP